MTCPNQRGRHVNRGHRVDHTCRRPVPPYPPIHHATGAAAVAALGAALWALAETAHLVHPEVAS